ncbi:MAG: DsbC family protein [Gammaproteobacteria bacterium]|nr:DsbC family protein [Gammaproteobacteria bacterium]
MKKLCLIVLLGLFGVQAVMADDADTADIRKALETLSPGAKPDSIAPSSIPGLYEVVVGADVLYVTKNGRYLLHGDMLDLQTKKNLTEDKRTAGRLKLVNAMPEDKMVVFAPKKVKHTITVFTDIDCPYCRKMHAEMAELNRAGIKVRYLLYPRAGLNSESYQKAVSVWCAKDHRAALTKAKATGDIERKNCANPVQEHMALADKVGVSGTPTLVLEDGTAVPGYVPAPRLAALLEGNGKGKAN